MPTLLHHLLPLAYLLVLVSAASNPTSFCKCTCGANSTIIPLDAPSSSSQHNTRSFLPPSSQQQPDEIFKLLRPRDDDESPAASSRASTSTAPKPTSTPSSGGKHDDNKEEDRKEYRQKTCNDCNKQYCLSQHLHICEGVKSEDVFTTCFRGLLFLPPSSSTSHLTPLPSPSGAEEADGLCG
ncbi:MAG: hypothetical protein L6R41_007052 [Letrouitia leprolyta]|nr:MAG: hypothetical protein L6R41_007052 [Letrouitia leprolyta]